MNKKRKILHAIILSIEIIAVLVALFGFCVIFIGMGWDWNRFWSYVISF